MADSSHSMNHRLEIMRTQQKTVIGDLQVLCASGEIFNHVDQGLPMWSGVGDRKVTLDIVFQTPFAAPPVITVGLIGIDSAHDQNLRFSLSAQEITEIGFKIEFSTWDDTHIARASISWQALGYAKPV